MISQSARRVAFALLLLASVSASPNRAQSGSPKAFRQDGDKTGDFFRLTQMHAA
jgi:hypothetical protein